MCNIRLIFTSLRNSPVLAVQEKQKRQSNVSHSSLQDGTNISPWNWTLVTVRIIIFHEGCKMQLSHHLWEDASRKTSPQRKNGKFWSRFSVKLWLSLFPSKSIFNGKNASSDVLTNWTATCKHAYTFFLSCSFANPAETTASFQWHNIISS